MGSKLPLYYLQKEFNRVVFFISLCEGRKETLDSLESAYKKGDLSTRILS